MLVITPELKAQIELSNFTATGRAGVSGTLATDYQAQGINPANLALEPTYEGKNVTFGLGEFGFSVFSDALSKVNLRSAVFDPSRKLTLAEKKTAAIEFANKGLTINFDFLYGGYSWQNPSGGWGFCFTVRERAQWYSKFNPKTSDILFNGFRSDYFTKVATDVIDTLDNGTLVFDSAGIAKQAQTLSTILDGTRISLAWFREYGFAYGVNMIHNFDLKLDIGVGVKYIHGIGLLDIEAKDQSMKAFIAASPGFKINFGELGDLAPSRDSSNLGFLPNRAGQGVGFEVGITGILKEKYRFSASVNDIGAVVYQTNVYTASDTLFTNIANGGFNNYNFIQNAEQFDGFQRDFIKWQGLKSRRYSLPTKLRLGAALIKEKYTAGLETVIPLNKASGNYEKPIFSVGAEYKGVNWLRVGSGFMFGGNYGSTFLVPLGITFVTSNGMWEMGVASRDIITYFKTKNPVLSLSTGLFRFRF